MLNAKEHQREALIVAQAGKPSMITVATNMAGRGTDIVLGGNVQHQAEAIRADEQLTDSEKEAKIHALEQSWEEDNRRVLEAGGLHIIGTERHESRRIDNQLRGRAGRQGDPGSSRFYLSFEDPLLRLFALDRAAAILNKLAPERGVAIEAGILTRQIENAQRKVEGRNFDMRKQVLEYDDVANDQRKVIYQQRNDILNAQDLTAQITALRHGCFEDLVRQYVPADSVEEQWDLPGLEKALAQDWQIELPLQKSVESSSSITDQEIVEAVRVAADEAYAAKVALVGAENFRPFERSVLLQSIDSNWREHLSALDYLRQGIHLRGYAQKQPKQEYKREAFELFSQMLDTVKNEVTRVLINVRVQTREQADEAAGSISQQAERVSNVTYTAPSETGEAQTLPQTPAGSARSTVAGAAGAGLAAGEVPRVGRNDPCPCGSGKRYKNCHGALS